MSNQVEQLKAKWQDLEGKAIALQNEKDAEMDKVRRKFTKKQQAAVDAAAKAQKEYLNREVAESLLGREDGLSVAESLIATGGLDLPKDIAEALKDEG